ncbi:hypothetical protein MPER_10435, partial [Moniliophthora perniciosa FA553]
MEPSQNTIRRLAALQEIEDEEEEGAEEEGTAKMSDGKTATPTHSPKSSADWRTANRLSNGWLDGGGGSGRNSVVLSAEDKRKSVSEPRLVEQHTGSSLRHSETESDTGDESDFEEAFNSMVDGMKLKPEKRQGMHALPLEQKKYLLRQHRQKSVISNTMPQISPGRHAKTFGPASASSITRIVPQLTGGDGYMKRLSSWLPGTTSDGSPTSGNFEGTMANGDNKAYIAEEPQPIHPQATGGYWGSWFASSGGKNIDGSPKAYVDGLLTYKTTERKLTKHLISVRIQLATSNAAWVQEFAGPEKGLDTLGNLLASLVGKGGKRRSLTETETTNLSEIIKCIQQLVKNEIEHIPQPPLITHITYAIYGASLKLRTLITQLLVAIIYLYSDGHSAVLSALSDYSVTYGEKFRFETLVASLRIPDVHAYEVADDVSGFGSEEEGIWEARTATMVLINELTGTPDSVEDRIILREEFGRRGLNEAIVLLQYIQPPDLLRDELNGYTQEKLADEQVMRERARALFVDHGDGEGSESE